MLEETDNPVILARDLQELYSESCASINRSKNTQAKYYTCDLLSTL